MTTQHWVLTNTTRKAGNFSFLKNITRICKTITTSLAFVAGLAVMGVAQANTVTWDAKLTAPIYLPWGTLDFWWPTFVGILWFNGIEKYVAAQYSGITDYNTPVDNWFQLTGQVYDEVTGEYVNLGHTGAISFLSAEVTTFGQFLIYTPGGNLLYDADIGALIPQNPDFSFSVTAPSEVSAVPAPPAIWLFVTGLPMLAAAARKRKKAISAVKFYALFTYKKTRFLVRFLFCAPPSLRGLRPRQFIRHYAHLDCHAIARNNEI